MIRERPLVPLAALLFLAIAACTTAPPRAGAGPAGPPSPDAGAAVAVAPPASPRPSPLERLRGLDPAAVCALPSAEVAPAVPGAAPFTRAEPSCPEDDHFCDFVERPPDPKDLCFVANTNIARAERESAAGARPAPVASAAWDPGSAPRFFERVESHLHLTRAEAALLRKSGFVVLDRKAYDSYALAFHDVFQQQLPVYVGVDPILHAVFEANEMLLEEVERTRLGPALGRLVPRMRRALGGAGFDRETTADLDVYLSVADRLLRGDDAPAPRWADESLVSALVESALSASELTSVELFGRPRMIDFTMYAPRGHYVGMWDQPGKPTAITGDSYFRTVTWLSRLELNLVSRSCRSSQPGEVPDPREPPREARDALALAELAARAGVLGELATFEDAYRVFAGRREDVSVPDLLALARAARLDPRAPNAPAGLRAAIGDRFRRTARMHVMPQGTGELPAIATLLGARPVPDVAPLERLVHASTDGRERVTAADVAYVLGHDRARRYLAPDLARWPELGASLDASRAELARGAGGRGDVYGAWMHAVRGLAEPPRGVVPSFMRSEAYADMRMGSALAAYAQIRHTFVLVAGQGYDMYGCEIPDGWVEPAVSTYRGLLAWVAAARTVAPSRARYLARVEKVLRMLLAISEAELAGAPLTEPQRRWLGMVAEHIPVGGYGGDSSAPPKYTGWYFDLFPDREIGALRGVDLVADWFTLTNAGEVRYLGVEKAALGVFVVDTGGAPRVMVGPVTKGYEVAGPIDRRLDDEAAREVPGKSAPWSASYLAPRVPGPELGVQIEDCAGEVRVVVAGAAPLGTVTATLLDHHGDPLTRPLSRVVGDEPAVFAFALPESVRRSAAGVEGIHLRVAAPPGAPGEPFDDVRPLRLVRPDPFGTLGVGVGPAPVAEPEPR